MGFHVEPRTLWRLEWPALVARLREHARTPRGRARLTGDGEGLFAATPEAMRERLAETAEARAVLAAGDRPPLAGVADLEGALARAEKGGILAPRELQEAAATLSALRGVSRFLALRRGEAPRLAERAAAIADLRGLETDLAEAVDASGELADAASSELAAARAEARRLAAEIQQRVDRLLRDPDVRECLSDGYYTVRADRYVLPVRADARGGVRGIVHDASNTGTTLFVEPEALVEANNRLKRAELAVQRETLRVLRDLSAAVAREADAIRSGLLALEELDLAFARAELAATTDATRPEVGEAGVLRLPLLRHPLLPPDAVVPNDLHLGDTFTALVISGPNAGGKTVALKAAGLAALLCRAGCFVPADSGARLDVLSGVLADIGDEQDIRESLSTFSAHVRSLARIVESADARTLVLLDEVGVGTDPGEGAALAQAALEALADAGARVVATTHLSLLKEMAAVDPRFANASVQFDPETLAPTYRLVMGAAGVSSALSVAARMGMPARVLERAGALLDREDRQLDRTLAELAASRRDLEREREAAERAREETESARAEARARLEALRERRDRLHATMRRDLDRAFRDAHDEVARVIRDLQRGGTAQDAARARERLHGLSAERRRREEELGVAPGAEEGEALPPVDWRRARPGQPVRIRGGGTGTLAALPDRRGRVAVQLGSARVVVPADRVGASDAGSAPAPRPVREARPPAPALGELDPAEDLVSDARLDLHGLRVDEALDRLVYALDRAAAAGRGRLVVLHGRGTGALREAVRRFLADSPYVSRFAPGRPEEGGEGVTIAELA